MIKKLFAGMAVGTLLLTACSSDDSFLNPGGDGTVTFTATLPDGINTRSSYDDGAKATALTCAVYDEAGNHIPGLDKELTMTDKKAEVNFNLVSGKKYTVVFWAQAPVAEGTKAPYTFDKETGKMTVNTAEDDAVKVKGVANDPNRDAFFAYESFEVKGAINKPITLKRPFAQINIGTSDLDDFKNAGGSINVSGLTVKDVPNVLDLKDGSVEGNVEYVYAPAEHVSETETEAFPAGAAYEWLGANFILVGDTKETINITWTSDNASNPAQEYTFIPVQRNYRTNIYGALLTNPANYEVMIDPSFSENGDYEKEIVSPWDGESKKMPVKNADGKYEINEAAEFIGFAEMLKSSNLANETFVLTSSIDLGGNKFEGLSGNEFRGTLDGGGNIIGNFYTTEDTETQPNYNCALVQSLRGTIKNLIVENVKSGNYFRGYAYGNNAGVVAGYNGGGRLENVTVRNCEVYGYGKVGALVGHDEGSDTGSTPRYQNCKVENTKIYGAYNSAELIGLAHADLNMSSCSAEGNTISCANYPNTKWTSLDLAIAYDSAKKTRKARFVSGEFNQMGSVFYTTGAKYYNRFDLVGNEGYRIMFNGQEIELDGYPVNDLGPVTEFPIETAPINGYADLYMAYDQIYFYNVAGLMSANAYIKANWGANTALFGKTFNLLADVDATGKTWDTPFCSPGSNAMDGIVIDGNNHTITGLALNGGLFGGQLTGSNTDTKPAKVKNLTMKNCSSTAGFHVGIIASQVYCDLEIDNVHIIGGNVKGTCNVGAFVGSTTLEGANANVAFKNCSVVDTRIEAVGGDGADSTGASIFLGRALVNMGGATSTITFENCSESGNTVVNPAGTTGGTWWAAATWSNGGWSYHEAM